MIHLIIKLFLVKNVMMIKKNNTPYQFLKNKNYFEEFEKRVLENKNISDYKKDNLLYKDDLDKYKTRFFNRN